MPTVCINEEEISTIRTECRLDCILNRETGVDVGEHLAAALGGIGPYKSSEKFSQHLPELCPSPKTMGGRTLFEDDDGGSLSRESHDVGLRGAKRRDKRCVKEPRPKT